MAIKVERTPREDDDSRELVSFGVRRRGEGELGKFQELFEELMGGEEGFGEDFDWDELWSSFMGEEEEGEDYGGGPTVPTGVMGPFGSRRPGGPFNYY